MIKLKAIVFAAAVLVCLAGDAFAQELQQTSTQADITNDSRSDVNSATTHGSNLQKNARTTLARTANPPFPKAPPTSDSWHFEAAPYLWAAALEGDLRVRNTTTHVESSFSDVFKQLDFAFATTFEASKGRWRLMLDENYVNLGTTGTGPLGRNTIAIEPTLNFFEFGASYAPVIVPNKDATDNNPLPPTLSVEILGGGRYTHLGLGLEPQNGNKVEGSRNLVDLFIGNRLKVRPHPAVTLSGKYTVGGGGSEFAWTAEGLVDLRFRKNLSAWGGYRILGMNADQASNAVGFDGQMRGLIFGMTIYK